MPAIVSARASEFTTEELKTLSLAGTISHRETRDEIYARAPLIAIMGMNQASVVKASTPRICFLVTLRTANRNNGPRNSREEGRKPADKPTVIAAGTINPESPRSTRQHRYPT